MTSDPHIGDETLIAYLDGELDEAGMAAVDTALATDATLVDRLEAHAALADRVRAAYAPVIDEALPASLTGLLGAPSPIVDLAEHRAARARPAWSGWTGGAMAACLAAGLVVGVLWPRAGLIGPDMTARGALAGALSAQLASAPTAGPVKVGLTFRATDRRLCRTFQTETQAGLACRQGEGWTVEMALARKAAAKGDFATAASDTPAPVLALVDEMMAGEALDAEQEAIAKAGGWR